MGQRQGCSRCGNAPTEGDVTNGNDLHSEILKMNLADFLEEASPENGIAALSKAGKQVNLLQLARKLVNLLQVGRFPRNNKKFAKMGNEHYSRGPLGQPKPLQEQI